MRISQFLRWLDLKDLTKLKGKRTTFFEGLMLSVRRARFKGWSILYFVSTVITSALWILLYYYLVNIQNNSFYQSFVFWVLYSHFDKVDVIFAAIQQYLTNSPQTQISFFMSLGLSILTILSQSTLYVAWRHGKEWAELIGLSEGNLSDLSDYEWALISTIPYLREEILEMINKGPIVPEVMDKVKKFLYPDRYLEMLSEVLKKLDKIEKHFGISTDSEEKEHKEKKRKGKKRKEI